MKRRDFLTTVAAASALPALPAGAAPRFAPEVYDKAVYYARLWGTSVPEMYTSALGLPLDQAEGLFDMLVRNRVMASPNASGIASAVSPFFQPPAVTRAVAEGVRRVPKGLDLKEAALRQVEKALEEPEARENPDPEEAGL